MLWLDKHSRFRQRLSPYLDGRLTPAEVTLLEAHLGSCGACQKELAELRATSLAVRDLPQVDAPRSFALTPQMLERRSVSPVPSAPPLAFGMRLASAGVAVALAAVLIGDLSNVGGGDDGGAARMESQDQSRTTAEFGAGGVEPSPGDLSAPAATSVAEEYDAGDETTERDSPPTSAPPGDTTIVSCPSGGSAGTASGGGAGAPGTTPVPTDSPETSPTSGAVEAGATCDETAVGATAPEASGTPEDGAAREGTDDAAAGEQAAAAEYGGGGTSALRVLELALAGSLVALLGAVVVEFAVRRQKAV